MRQSSRSPDIRDLPSDHRDVRGTAECDPVASATVRKGDTAMIRAMMRRSVFSGTVVVAVASTILAVLALGPAGATPPAGFTPTLLAKGTTARALTEQVGGMKFQADGPVDMYTVAGTFDPGG